MPSKGELTKQKLLRTARELFYLNGYTNTSIDEILKSSKIKKGNLYFHFRSKEELGYAVIDSYLAEETEVIDRFLAGPGRPMERIYRLLDSSSKHLRKQGCRGGCPIGNFALEMSDIHNGFRKKINKVFDAWCNRLEKLLSEAKRNGELPPSIDPKALACFMVAVWEGGAMLVKTRKDPRILGDCIKSLKGIVEACRV
ncbi:MAG TPA: TetR family transcriptional regulator C-terminal domain-containing protein [Nitrospiria bacterium]|nr:TetR family transcriptional regulator C-terminal domain-containing protein [Nitrospiria bacterium]